MTEKNQGELRKQLSRFVEESVDDQRMLDKILEDAKKEFYAVIPYYTKIDGTISGRISLEDVDKIITCIKKWFGDSEK